MKKLTPWGKEVAIELIRRDWSMKDLAEKVGVHPKHLSYVIRGERGSDKLIRYISDLLDIEDEYEEGGKS